MHNNRSDVFTAVVGVYEIRRRLHIPVNCRFVSADAFASSIVLSTVHDKSKKFVWVGEGLKVSYSYGRFKKYGQETRV